MKYTSISNEGILVDLATGSGFFGQDWDPQETLGTSTLLIIMLCMRACSVVSDCDPVDCSPPGSSVHGILQARVLE